MKKLIYALFVVIPASIAVFFFVPISHFPSPKGPYGVGQRSCHWIDKSRKEVNVLLLGYTEKDLPNREMMSYVFYPTKKDAKAKMMLFDPDAAQSTMDNFARMTKLPAWLFSGIRFLKTHSQKNVSLAENQKNYPVIIFSHGGGPMIQHYTWLLEMLASHGFVVVGINHPYVANTVRFPDNRVIESIMARKKKFFKNRESYEVWRAEQVETHAQDVSFAITKIEELAAGGDEFWRKVDMTRIGKLGQSFGGAVSVRATRKDKRITCGVNMDERLSPKDVDVSFDTPFLFLLADKSHQWAGKNKKKREEVLRLVRSEKTNMYAVTFSDIAHGVFSDAPFYHSTTLFTRLVARFIDPRLGVGVKKAVDVLVNIVKPYVLEFFEKHLKGKQSKLFSVDSGELFVDVKK